jgi:hypothetical protein
MRKSGGQQISSVNKGQGKSGPESQLGQKSENPVPGFTINRDGREGSRTKVTHSGLPADEKKFSLLCELVYGYSS